jgi:enamine deaminase RidA (YjgF/YER057c/UK114 family)
MVHCTLSGRHHRRLGKGGVSAPPGWAGEVSSLYSPDAMIEIEAIAVADSAAERV